MRERRGLRYATWFWFLLTSVPVGSSAAGSKPPNVIFITVDTFRPDHISYFGYPRDTTPALDRFCREGAFFRQAFSSSAWTTPGLISLLTSLDAPTHGVDIRHRSLAPAVITLPEAMIQAGYRAPDIFFLTEIPNFANLGFEPYAHREELIDRGDEILFHWLESEAAANQPFLLYYHYRDLHLPYNTGEPYESRYLAEAFSSRFSLVTAMKRFLAAEKLAVVRGHVMITRGLMDFSSWDRPWVSALYDAEIRRMDDELFARLYHSLGDTGLDRNTLVVVSADHGEELLDHDLIGHVSTFKEGRLYDEVIRIPLVLWMPGRLVSGIVVDEPVSCLDVMPTILSLAGVPVPADAQGQSLLPLVDGTPGWERRPLFLETSAAGFMADDAEYARRFHAVRTERWKLVHASATNDHVLFDLAADPREQRDVAARYPTVADSLRSLLAEWVVRSQVHPQASIVAAVDSPGAPSVASADPPVRILSPRDGDTLRYLGTDHNIGLEWTGAAGLNYVVKYEVGEGDYRVDGELVAVGNAPQYGPFQPSVWNSLVLYNPWRFRVYPKGLPDQTSEWVTFVLAPAPDSLGAVQYAGFGPATRAAATSMVLHGVQLLGGLTRGCLDLYLWIGAIPAADLSAYGLLLVIAVAIAWPQLARFGVVRVKRWTAALLYIALVYATVPVMPMVWDRLRDYTHGSVRYLGIVAVVLVAATVVYQVWQRHRGHRWRPYLALLGIFVVYAYLLSEYAVFPSERLHLVEYGFVGGFLFRALRLDLSRRQAYLASFAVTVSVGVGDECIQWLLPQRFFELKDIQLNALSGALGLLVLRFGLEQPKSETEELRGDSPSPMAGGL